MNCDCITRVNEKLSDNNLALDTLFLLDSGKSTLAIGTHFKDVDKKKRGDRPTNLLVTFCPFCGTKADGSAKPPASAKCPHCKGKKSIRIGRGLSRTTEGCPDCAGTGRILSREEMSA